jgi:hypothetical protein
MSAYTQPLGLSGVRVRGCLPAETRRQRDPEDKLPPNWSEADSVQRGSGGSTQRSAGAPPQYEGVHISLLDRRCRQ